MATLTQLKAEPVWGAEFAPPSIVALGRAVRAHFGLEAYAIGTKGDRYHLRGYHRSRAWVKNSAYCTDRSYSIKETAGNREGGNDNWVCALDISAPPAVLLPMCQRLDAAVRAGRLEKITEWYGNFDGDGRVDGYNNIADRVASSDSSHLTHGHISFDRGRAGEDHADLLAILTGVEEDAMTKEQWYANWRQYGMQMMQDPIVIPANPALGVTAKVEEPNMLARAIRSVGGWQPTDEELAQIAAAAKAGAEAGAPTHDELAQAAFEGAQRAEQE